jgi:opacity protein-like surface antigen
MKSFILAAALALIMACGSAIAQDATCASKAVGKDGRPLAGAAKTSFMNKCCEDSAVSKDSKPLSGAAKTSFVKKCTSG